MTADRIAVTAKTAAQLLDVPVKRVYQLVANGDLDGFRVAGSDTHYLVEDLVALARRLRDQPRF